MAESRVLDLGCGNGMISEYISDLTSAHVTGVDFIARAIQDACQRTAAKRERLDFLMKNTCELSGIPVGSTPYRDLLAFIYNKTRKRERSLRK